MSPALVLGVACEDALLHWRCGPEDTDQFQVLVAAWRPPISAAGFSTLTVGLAYSKGIRRQWSAKAGSGLVSELPTIRAKPGLGFPQTAFLDDFRVADNPLGIGLIFFGASVV